MTSGDKNKVIFSGKHEVSGSNEGSTTFLRQLPVLTGNDSSDRKSDITTRSFIPNYICPEIFDIVKDILFVTQKLFFFCKKSINEIAGGREILSGEI